MIEHIKKTGKFPGISGLLLDLVQKVISKHQQQAEQQEEEDFPFHLHPRFKEAGTKTEKEEQHK
ncbi:MAG: hypothetical protein GX495_07240 [Chloroflexi bacterium]|nr:hypothetical protein [Chloroflexota bacterium]